MFCTVHVRMYDIVMTYVQPPLALTSALVDSLVLYPDLTGAVPVPFRARWIWEHAVVDVLNSIDIVTMGPG